MKTISLLTLTVAAASLVALTAQAGILNSPHDFSSQAWNTDPADPNTVCSTCHTPHHADGTVVPLWAHATTVASFTMYSKSSVPSSQIVFTPAVQPNGISKACLSCHDGTVAINTYGGQPSLGGTMTTHGTATFITNSANLGTDLSHSHPISFTYDNTIVGSGPGKDQWLYNPDATPVLTPASGTFVAGNDMSINGFLLNGNHSLECTSCHDVHNQNGTPFDISSNPKLVKIVGIDAGGHGSLLCRSCHNK